jgi:hypothetical protein
MRIKEEKREIANLLKHTNEEWILKAVKRLLQNEVDYSYSAIHGGNLSIEEYNRQLNEADKRISKGQFTSHEKAVKAMSKW